MKIENLLKCFEHFLKKTHITLKLFDFQILFRTGIFSQKISRLEKTELIDFLNLSAKI